MRMLDHASWALSRRISFLEVHFIKARYDVEQQSHVNYHTRTPLEREYLFFYTLHRDRPKKKENPHTTTIIQNGRKETKAKRTVPLWVGEEI